MIVHLDTLFSYDAFYWMTLWTYNFPRYILFNMYWPSAGRHANGNFSGYSELNLGWMRNPYLYQYFDYPLIKENDQVSVLITILKVTSL